MLPDVLTSRVAVLCNEWTEKRLIIIMITLSSQSGVDLTVHILEKSTQ